MPSYEVPPEESASVKPFDPLVLDRALLALLGALKKYLLIVSIACIAHIS